MPFCFSDDKPRTCCCGWPLRVGIIVITVLALIEGVIQLCSGWGVAAIPSLIFGGTGLWTLLKPENATARVINFWVWAVMYGIGMIVFAILLVLGTMGTGSF